MNAHAFHVYVRVCGRVCDHAYDHACVIYGHDPYDHGLCTYVPSYDHDAFL